MEGWILKYILNLADGFGRLFVYNNNSPEVGEVIEDISYGDHPKQKLDIIIPEKKRTEYPVLVFIHGGGWISGDKSSHRRIAKVFASKGYLVVNINYRLAPKYKFPVQFQDVSKAIKYVYKNISNYGGDYKQLFLGGDSAGAYLASWYAAALKKQKLFQKTNIKNSIPVDFIRGLLLFYGLYDLDKSRDTNFFKLETMLKSFLGKAVEYDSEKVKLGSPIRHLTKDYPPVFICSGEKDNLHQESIRFVKKLSKLNIDYKKLFFNKEYKCQHGFLNLYFYKSAQIAMKNSIKFLDTFSKKQI